SDARQERPVPADGGRARCRAAHRRLAGRAERGRLPRHPRERRRGAPPLGGRIAIQKKGKLAFGSMQPRLPPAESRIRKLSAEIPAQFIVFDILLWKGEKLHKLPLEKRRKELERKAKR